MTDVSGGKPAASSLFAPRTSGYTVTQFPQRDEAAMSNPEPGFSNSKPAAEQDAETTPDPVSVKVVAESSVEDKAVRSSKARKK